MQPETNLHIHNHSLWKAFTANQDLVSSRHCAKNSCCGQRATTKKLGFWRSLSRLSPFGTVYAKEIDSSSTDNSRGDSKHSDSDTQTTMEKLGQAKPSVIISDEEITNYMAGETGRSRVHDLFTKNEDGSLHPDLDMISQSVIVCSSTVFIVTSVFGSRAARETFLLKNKHKKFETKFLYARAYNDALFLGGFKFGMKWAFKTAFFSVLFLVTAQTIATYRNRTSVWEYMAGGGMTGAVLRFNLGPKGMVAGGIIGSTLGLIGGSCIYLLLTAANETQQQKHYWRISETLRKQRELELQFNIGRNESPSPPPLDVLKDTQIS